MFCACRGIPNFQDIRGTMAHLFVGGDGEEPVTASGQVCHYMRGRDLDPMLPHTGAHLHVQQSDAGALQVEYIDPLRSDRNVDLT